MLRLWFIIISTTILSVKFASADSNWELAAAVSDKIDLINRTGYVIKKFDVLNGYVTTLAYDPKHEEIYFTNNNDSQTSVYRLDPFSSSNEYQPIVKKQTDGNITSLAFDTFTRTLYWAVGHKIKYVKLDEAELPSTGIVLHEFKNEFSPVDLTVDVCDSTLYWTNQFYYNNYSLIQKSKLDSENKIITFLEVPTKAYGIVIDQSADRLYWSGEGEGSQMYIKSLQLHGGEGEQPEKVVEESNGHRPTALTILDSQCYWTDIISNKFYTAEKTVTGKNKVLSLSMHTKKAYNVKVFGIISVKQNSFINPEDCLKVVAPNNQQDEENRDCVKPDHGEDQFVERNRQKVMLCKESNRSEMKEKNECTVRTGGITQDLCNNYCLNEGRCSVINNNPKCYCKQNWGGKRCETDLCGGYCHNGGTCFFESGNKKCNCRDGFKGDRCEQHILLEQYVCIVFCSNLMNDSAVEILSSPDSPLVKRSSCSCSSVNIPKPVLSSPSDSDNNNSLDRFISAASSANIHSGIQECTSETWMYIALIILALMCLLLMVTVAILFSKVMSLRKRPRIKKRIIVNKNVTPLTSRPQGTEQCEITIENCCNMNICETPCFEPDFRRPHNSEKSKKEEKKGLLTSIDLPPDDLY